MQKGPGEIPGGTFTESAGWCKRTRSGGANSVKIGGAMPAVSSADGSSGRQTRGGEQSLKNGTVLKRREARGPRGDFFSIGNLLPRVVLNL